MFQENIDKQLEYNKGKNLFYYGIINSLRFTPETIDAIGEIGKTDPDGTLPYSLYSSISPG